MQLHKLAHIYVRLHRVTEAYMKIHEFACISWACMQFNELACSFMSLHAVPFIVWAAHKNFAVFAILNLLSLLELWSKALSNTWLAQLLTGLLIMYIRFFTYQIWKHNQKRWDCHPQSCNTLFFPPCYKPKIWGCLWCLSWLGFPARTFYFYLILLGRNCIFHFVCIHILACMTLALHKIFCSKRKLKM